MNETKRDNILKAALTLFAEQGYEKTTVQQIAKKAGVGKGTTYEYFNSKEQLFYEVIQTGLNSIFERLIEAVETKGTAYERIKNMFYKNLSIFQDELLLKEIMLNNVGKIPPELQQWAIKSHHQMVLIVEKVVAEGIEAGEMKKVNPRVFASTLIHTMNIIYFYQLSEDQTLEGVIEEQLKIYF